MFKTEPREIPGKVGGWKLGVERSHAVRKVSPVLQEFQRVKQEPGVPGRRRWFQGDGLELIVWLDETGTPDGFQLCYAGELRREHALTWRRSGGFTHSRVDTGDTRPDKNLTPILTPDGAVPWETLRREFAAGSGALEPALREFIIARLAEGGR